MEIDSSKKVNSRNRFRYICSVEKPLKNSGFGKIPLCYQKKKGIPNWIIPQTKKLSMWYVFSIWSKWSFQVTKD